MQLQYVERMQQIRENTIIYGYNQEWYGTEFKRLAGCGPTTATFLAQYVLCRDGYIGEADLHSKEAVLRAMNAVWHHVTPGRGGLYKTKWFLDGLQAYLDEQADSCYETKMLRIYPFHLKSVAPETAASFLTEALQQDSPIAFLNRHNGGEEGLSTWHWVPIIGMVSDGDDYRVTCYDEEEERHFSLRNWLKNTSLGGGFVYVSRT